MGDKKKSKASASTWVILFLGVVIVCLCVFQVFSMVRNNNQKDEINNLNERIKEMEQPKEMDMLSYQKLYPEMKNPLPKEWKRSDKTIYLTFDDGPSKVTSGILKTLKQENVKATFFVIGAGSDHSLLKKIADDGHVVGVHTYSHDYKKMYNSVDSYVEDIYKIYKLIQDETGISPTVYRYPGGSNNTYNVLNQTETTAEMFRRGFVPFDWNYDSRDATAVTVPVNTIVKSSTEGIGADRVILLMHDAAAKTTTAKALPEIIKKYKAAGYKFDVLTNEVAPILFSTPDGERYD